MKKIRGIRYYIGMTLYNINEKKEEKYWSDPAWENDDDEKPTTEAYFNYLGQELFSYFYDVSSRYAYKKTTKNKTLFQWYFWKKFYSMYIPEKIYRLFCDLLKLDY